jgi:magnesium chelatase family protein
MVMLAHVFSGTNEGLDGVVIDVEVDIASRGFPSINLVGLPSKAIEESKDRIRSAIVNIGFEMPDSRLTINLAPADIPKVGSGFDLPIALGILSAAGMVEKKSLKNSLFIGELSLEGRVRPVSGVLPLALLARKQKIKYMYVPVENAIEAAVVPGISVIPIFTLEDAVLHLNGVKSIKPLDTVDLAKVPSEPVETIDFKSISGQETAKRAMEIAAAGFHNIHLKGVPGAGKTLLSRAFPSILPPLLQEEMLEVSRIYSIVGLLTGKGFIKTRPFRSPHHTTSRIGLIGGGTHPMPGEISLAHRGVLFLDEFPEFPRSTIESLRQPVEDGVVSISRASGSVSFPSRFILVAASNPCPCGYLGHPVKRCKCSLHSIAHYQKRLSGPILDRIDIHVDVPPVKHDKLLTFSHTENETSEAIRERVMHARAVQHKRFGSFHMNGEMTTAEIRSKCVLNPAASSLLKTAVSRLALSARSYFKIIKIAQTIADLAHAEMIEGTHIAEALQYRPRED